MKTCPEKMKLFDAYQKATRAHSEAVARLHRTMGTSSKADYEVLYRMTEALRTDAVAKHGC
jgi:hypothetical protein